jgi:hypothetical protein
MNTQYIETIANHEKDALIKRVDKEFNNPTELKPLNKTDDRLLLTMLRKEPLQYMQLRAKYNHETINGLIEPITTAYAYGFMQTIIRKRLVDIKLLQIVNDNENGKKVQLRYYQLNGIGRVVAKQKSVDIEKLRVEEEAHTNILYPTVILENGQPTVKAINYKEKEQKKKEEAKITLKQTIGVLKGKPKEVSKDDIIADFIKELKGMVVIKQ